jgi:hypothetical protein
VWGGAPRKKDAADHLFDGKVSEVADAIDDLLGDFSS